MARKAHYIDNKKFYIEMLVYREMVDEARKRGLREGVPYDEIRLPPATEFMGKCFMDIAMNLSNKPNFVNYTYKEEMIGDGIENCLQYCSNFNPEKSKNPFAYFTQIIYYAFVRRIEREKKQAYVKHKLSERMIEEKRVALYDENDNDNKGLLDHVKPNEGFDVEDYENKMVQKREQRKKNKKSLERFME
tara:strand:+ start:3707 stop:4276 length:570 start_codon:yes stop_codon:yes gene_type:complete